MTDHSIKGKIVIIAGGAKNLGGLIARDLAAHGAKAVAIHYNSDSTKAEADATIAAIKAAGAQAVAFQADLTRAGAMEKLFADVVDAIGRPDIAINTVGKVLKKPIVDISEAEYDQMSDVNAKSAFFFLKEAGKHLNDNGKICMLVTALLGLIPHTTPRMRAPRLQWSISCGQRPKSWVSGVSQSPRSAQVRWIHRSSIQRRVPMRWRTTRRPRRCRNIRARA